MRSPMGMKSANNGLVDNTPRTKKAGGATTGVATGVVAVGGNIDNIQKIDTQEDSIMPGGDDTIADYLR